MQFSYAIDKTENYDISDEDIMEAPVSNIYAAYTVCDHSDLAAQLHEIWNELIHRSEGYIDRTDVLIERLTQPASPCEGCGTGCGWPGAGNDSKKLLRPSGSPTTGEVQSKLNRFYSVWDKLKETPPGRQRKSCSSGRRWFVQKFNENRG